MRGSPILGRLIVQALSLNIRYNHREGAPGVLAWISAGDIALACGAGDDRLVAFRVAHRDFIRAINAAMGEMAPLGGEMAQLGKE